VKEDVAGTRALEFILSIKGIGEKSAAYLIAELPDMTSLSVLISQAFKQSAV
jgi:hypothetical protein